MKQVSLIHGADGLYRLSLGKYVTNGKTTYKKFRLGADKAEAQKMAAALQVAWAQETQTDFAGEKVWSDESIAKAKAFASPSPEPKPQVQQTQIPHMVPPSNPALCAQKGEMTLHKAFDLWTKHLDGIETISVSHKLTQTAHIKSLKKHIKDIPLAKVTNKELLQMRKVITARPDTSAHNKLHKISITTVKNWLTTLGLAFNYFAREEMWMPDKAFWRENFALDKQESLALTKDEPRQLKKTFKLSDLVEIYRRATPGMQMYMLLALNCGWTQIDIATFQKVDFQTNGNGNGNDSYITRPRNKTGVEGSWWIFPELAEMLKRSIPKTPAHPSNLALLSDEGQELMRTNHDTIGQRWRRLMDRQPEGVTKLPFKYLRKFASQVVLNLSGSKALAKSNLSHSQNGDVLMTNYAGDDIEIGVGQTQQNRLHEIHKLCWAALKPMFDAATPQAEMERRQKIGKEIELNAAQKNAA